MLGHVQAHPFLLGACPQGGEEAHQLEEGEGSQGGVHDGGQDRHRLDPELHGVAEEEAVRHPVPGLLGEDAGEEGPGDPPDPVAGEDVQAVVQPGPRPPEEDVVAGEGGKRPDEEGGERGDEACGRGHGHQAHHDGRGRPHRRGLAGAKEVQEGPDQEGGRGGQHGVREGQGRRGVGRQGASPLKPNQPNQRRAAPRRVKGTLWGRMACRP